MGLRLFGSSFGEKTKVVREVVYERHPNDPDPELFKICEIEQRGDFVIAKIRYPNCTNFDGLKVLVWRNRTVEEIKKMVLIDPHFLEEDLSLIARFMPMTGMKMARKFVESMRV
jgi:hypothetical protein